MKKILLSGIAVLISAFIFCGCNFILKQQDTEIYRNQNYKTDLEFYDQLNKLSYGYKLLSQQEKIVYNQVYEAIINFSARADIISIEYQRAGEIVELVMRDHPELFWFEYGATYCYDDATDMLEYIEFDYLMTNSQAQKCQAEINNSIGDFLKGTDQLHSEYEKALAVYQNVIELVEYDFLADIRLEKESINPKASVYSAFVEKKTVCSGYAKAVQYLLNMLGIECYYATSDIHAWNIARIDGDYYHIDATWGDKSEQGTDGIDYAYFCITTQEIERLNDHDLTEGQNLPVCQATDCNYYIKNGLYFKEYDHNKLNKCVDNSLNNNKILTIKCCDKNTYETFVDNLFEQQEIFDIVSDYYDSGGISLKYSLNDSLYIITVYFG